jgi:hypothetical protein
MSAKGHKQTHALQQIGWFSNWLSRAEFVKQRLGLFQIDRVVPFSD